MHPVLFEVFGFPVRTFGVLVGLGAIAGYFLARARAERFGVSKDFVADVGFWVVIAGIVGARLGWVVQDLSTYLDDPIAVLNIRAGGMTSFGGIIGGFGALWYACRRHKVQLWRAADLLGAPMLLGHAIGRVGCFFNGCCYGSACTLPWAVEVHSDDGLNYLGHPAQLYDTLVTLALMGVLLIIERKRMNWIGTGRFFASMIVFYGAARTFFEFFRAGASSHSSLGWSVPDAQIASVVMVVVGLIMFSLMTAPSRTEATG